MSGTLLCYCKRVIWKRRTYLACYVTVAILSFYFEQTEEDSQNYCAIWDRINFKGVRDAFENDSFRQFFSLTEFKHV